MDGSSRYTHTSAAHPRLRQLMAGGALRPAAADPLAVATLRAELGAEIVQVLRYRHNHFVTGGAHPRSVGERTLPPFAAEDEHAAHISARILELDGGLDFMPATLAAIADAAYMEGKSLREMVRDNLAAERASIGIYSELIRRFGSEDPGTRGMLEAVVAAEQGRARHLERLLAAAPAHAGHAAAV